MEKSTYNYSRIRTKVLHNLLLNGKVDFNNEEQFISYFKELFSLTQLNNSEQLINDIKIILETVRFDSESVLSLKLNLLIESLKQNLKKLAYNQNMSTAYESFFASFNIRKRVEEYSNHKLLEKDVLAEKNYLEIKKAITEYEILDCYMDKPLSYMGSFINAEYYIKDKYPSISFLRVYESELISFKDIHKKNIKDLNLYVGMISMDNINDEDKTYFENIFKYSALVDSTPELLTLKEKYQSDFKQDDFHKTLIKKIM